MGTLQTQRFEGTVAAALTTANTGYALVNPSGDSRFTFQNPPAAEVYGGTVGRIVAVAGQVNEGRWTLADCTSAAGQLLAYFTGHATAAACDLATLRGTSQNLTVRYRTDSTITLLNMTGGDVAGRRFTPPLNAWLLIDYLVIEGTTSSNGRVAYKARRLDDLGGTPLIDYDSGTTVDAGVIGTAVINSSRAGKITSATAAVPTFYIAAHDVEDGRTTYLPTPSLAVDGTLTGITGAAAATGQVGTFSGSSVSTGPAGHVQVIGQPGAFTGIRNATLVGVTGSAAASSSPGTLSATRNATLAGQTGMASATGHAGTFTGTRSGTLVGTTGTMQATGHAATFTGGVVASGTLAGTTGTVTVSGKAATLTGQRNATLAGITGTVQVTGHAGSTTGASTLHGTTGIAAVTGQVGVLTAIANVTLAGLTGHVAVIGVAGTFRQSADARDITLTITGPTGHPMRVAALAGNPMTVHDPTGHPMRVTGPRS